jgi:hypothetical protein
LVIDREDVVKAIAPTMLAGGRIRTQGGSFFEEIPTGANIYLLVRVLHDWADDDALRILRTCRVAMKHEARLVIAETILEADPSLGHPVQYFMDVQMMAMYGGARERSEAEFERLLNMAGFVLLRTISASPVSILEARPQP